MDAVRQELRVALRALRRNPGHAMLATLILASGLGLTLFMFSAINAYVLKPLPFPDSDEVVHLEIALGRQARDGSPLSNRPCGEISTLCPHHGYLSRPERFFTNFALNALR